MASPRGHIAGKKAAGPIAAVLLAIGLSLSAPVAADAQQADTSAPQSQDATPAPEQQPPEQPAASQPAVTAPGLPAAIGPADKRLPGERADDWKVELDNMDLALDREGVSEDQLSAIRARAERIVEEASRVLATLQPQINEIRTRLNQLGPAPAEGEPPEAEEISARRAAETATLGAVDAAAKKVRLTIVQAEEIIRDVASLRRDRFAQSLLVRNRSIVDPSLWIDGIEAVPTVTRSFGYLLADSWSVFTQQISARSVGILLGALMVAIVLAVFVRGYVRRFAPPVGDETEVPRLKKLSRAVLVVISDGLIPVAAVGVLYLALDLSGLVAPRLAEMNRGIIAAAAVFGFLFGLARAICAPMRPGWRLANLPDTTAAQTVVTATLIAAVLAVGVYLETVNDLLYSPVSIEVIKRATMALLIAILTATGLWRLSVARRSVSASESEQVNLLLTWFRRLVWLIVAGIIAALFTGYIALANFMAIQLVFAGAVFAVVWLLLGLIEELVNAILSPTNRIGDVLSSAFGISETGINQIALVASGVIRLVVIVLGAILVMLPWGLDTGQWRIWIQKAFFGFRLGEVNISLSSILTALVLFAVGIVATRAVQRWLGNRFLPNTRLDVGLRNSISTVVGYIGITIAAIFAVTYMGFNLQNVALLAGALSVGIGFGLQSIVNNFVSGLILLAERPIKEGDWIVVGAEQGNVRKIAIRSTEIETFDRATVIVPNSDLITGTVKNWMHSSMMGRIIVPIGVGYDSDPEQVRDILLDIARSHEGVLAYPEPRVYFMDFGDSSLVFNLYAFVSDVNSSLTVRSDFRFEILKRLREANIEIPFPQRDINFRDIDRLETAIAGPQPPAGTPAPAAGKDAAGKDA